MDVIGEQGAGQAVALVAVKRVAIEGEGEFLVAVDQAAAWQPVGLGHWDGA